MREDRKKDLEKERVNAKKSRALPAEPKAVPWTNISAEQRFFQVRNGAATPARGDARDGNRRGRAHKRLPSHLSSVRVPRLPVAQY